MELRQLNHFLAIAKHGSLGRAAEAVAISEPGLSKSLAKLEAELGVRLFDRETKGVSLTIYGQSLLPRAEAIIGEVETIRREIEEVQSGRRGTVRIGMRPSFGAVFLPHALAEIMKTRKDLRTVLREGSITAMTEELKRGELDFMVVTELQEIDDSLIQEYLRDSPVKILVRHDNPLVGKTSLTPDELASLEWTMPLPTDPIRRTFYDILKSNGVSDIQLVMETNSPLVMKNLVREIGCAAFFPIHLYDANFDRDLIFLEVEPLSWNRRLNVVRRRFSNLPPSADAVLHELRNIGSVSESAGQSFRKGVE